MAPSCRRVERTPVGERDRSSDHSEMTPTDRHTTSVKTRATHTVAQPDERSNDKQCAGREEACDDVLEKEEESEERGLRKDDLMEDRRRREGRVDIEEEEVEVLSTASACDDVGTSAKRRGASGSSHPERECGCCHCLDGDEVIRDDLDRGRQQ
jgi:hypothetical protein